jgi:hypothetical protein
MVIIFQELIKTKDMENEIRKTGRRKVSVEQCKKMLNRNGNNYTDEEVEKIRDFLYILVHIEMEYIKTRINHEEEKLRTLYPSEYRRAS